MRSLDLVAGDNSLPHYDLLLAFLIDPSVVAMPMVVEFLWTRFKKVMKITARRTTGYS